MWCGNYLRRIVVVVVGFVCMYEEYRRRYVSNGEKPKRLFVGDFTTDTYTNCLRGNQFEGGLG